MTKKLETELAKLQTDRNNCIKQMSLSWSHHFKTYPDSQLSEYVGVLLAQIERQNTQIKELQNDKA
ncbi:hypothetical protein [Vibrio phage vB_VpS_PG28]|nr:hypothetical protein [Vibrio phage vB_VpS_PG28]